MSRRGKKGVLAASLNNASTEIARGVAVEGKIGKCLPPKKQRWKPGQSGNPSGKPSAHREVIIDAVKAMLAEVDPQLNKNLFERLLEQCARRALQGSKWHMGVLLDYGLGKPRQGIEMDAKVLNLEAPMTLEEADQRIRKCLADPLMQQKFGFGPALPADPPVNVLERFDARERQRDAALRDFALLGTGEPAEPLASTSTAPSGPKSKVRVEL